MDNVYRELDELKAEMEKLKAECLVKTELVESLKKTQSEVVIKFQETMQQKDQQAHELQELTESHERQIEELMSLLSITEQRYLEAEKRAEEAMQGLHLPLLDMESGVQNRMSNEDIKIAAAKISRQPNMANDSTKNATVASDGETQTPGLVWRVHEHGDNNNLNLLKEAYDPMKGDYYAYRNLPAPTRKENESNFFMQESPMGNTVLHIAAGYGYDKGVDEAAQKAPNLLTVQNSNGDTALHVAAKAGHISTLKRLLVALVHNLPFPYSEKPKEALDKILVKNKQGNTFFHEALLNSHTDVTQKKNSHKDVINFLRLDEELFEAGFKELVERAALFWTNKEEKSVLYLAIEFEYKEVVDHALTKLISQGPALDQLNELIKNHQELYEMIPHGPDYVPAGKSPLREQDQGSRMDNQPRKKDEVEALRPRLLRPPPKPMASADAEIMKEKLKVGSSRNENPQELTKLISQDSSLDKFIKNHQKFAQLIPYGPHYVPAGKSPLLAAILKQDQDILHIILTKKKEWIHLRDTDGRVPLHYAASIGYLKGVEYLLGICISCTMVRDNYGFFPLHLASQGGHDKELKKLLEHCPDPKEMLDNYGRNILHIAVESGKFNVVRCILQASDGKFKEMINDKDANGNTALHLATLHCHPRIVYALTWHNGVDLNLINKKNQTALDAYLQFPLENPSLQQRLTWIALKSAGVPYADKLPCSYKVPLPLQSAESTWKQEAPNMDQYKDRINTLMLVSTLIITATFAAGFTVPGGTNGSDPGQGMALMLHHMWFKLFIFCITISMYGAISVTIILIWAQLGDITLAQLALKVPSPLLGITLATLSLAFLAGVHLVISDLSWLATTFLVLCVIFILVLLFLYTLLWLPSSSSFPIIRYISYFPFLFWASRVEPDQPGDTKPQRF